MRILSKWARDVFESASHDPRFVILMLQSYQSMIRRKMRDEDFVEYSLKGQVVSSSIGVAKIIFIATYSEASMVCFG
eukprot:scaffold18025_cov50-Cyclotella_meneghiniana.AAC.2